MESIINQELLQTATVIHESWRLTIYLASVALSTPETALKAGEEDYGPGRYMQWLTELSCTFPP